LNLQHFAEEGGTEDGGEPTPEPNKGDDPNKQEHMIPKSRFDEVNNQFKEMQNQLNEINKVKEIEEFEVKKQKGEFENLYKETASELEIYKKFYMESSERVTQLEMVIQTMVDSELEAVPEDMRDLVPESFSAEQKLQWITSAKKKGIFGTRENKEEQVVGGATNQQQTQEQDINSMSISQLMRSAYGKKK
jgi:hypothetical protein